VVRAVRERDEYPGRIVLMPQRLVNCDESEVVSRLEVGGIPYDCLDGARLYCSLDVMHPAAPGRCCTQAP
jgi:hypothetical protein